MILAADHDVFRMLQAVGRAPEAPAAVPTERLLAWVPPPVSPDSAKKAPAVAPSTAPIATPPPQPTKPPASDGSADALRFRRRSLPRTPSPASKSALKALLTRAPVAALNIRVYVYRTVTDSDTCANGSVTVGLSMDATVEDTMVAALRHPDYPHPAYDQSCYELRLMDDEEKADFDMPALDRRRGINKFGVREFCLCLLRVPRSAALSPSPVPSRDCTPAAVLLKQSGHGLMKVIIGAVKVNLKIVPSDRRLADLVPKLRTKKVKLPLYLESIEFVLTEADRQRLGVRGSALALSCELSRLHGVTSLTLRRKTFADTGLDEREDRASMDVGDNGGRRESYFDSRRVVSLVRRGTSGSDTPVRDGRTDVAPSQIGRVISQHGLQGKAYIFNTLTAAEYKSWVVSKTNKWGMTQKRRLGVSLTQITNGKAGDDPNDKDVKRKNRNITDVVRVELEQESGRAGGKFSIIYQEEDGAGGGETTMTYETEKVEEAQEIVAKIQYIQGLIGGRASVDSRAGRSGT